MDSEKDRIPKQLKNYSFRSLARRLLAERDQTEEDEWNHYELVKRSDQQQVPHCKCHFQLYKLIKSNLSIEIFLRGGPGKNKW